MRAAELAVAVLILACGAWAQNQTVNYNSVTIVAPDFSGTGVRLYAQFFNRTVSGTGNVNAGIQSITVSPPACPANALSCGAPTGGQIFSMGIVIYTDGSGSVTPGPVNLGLYSDSNNTPGGLLAQVSLSNLQGTPPGSGVRINEANFSVPYSTNILTPTKFWTAFLVPANVQIAPIYFLSTDNTVCPKYAVASSFPATGSSFTVACDNTTVYIITIGYKATIPIVVATPPPEGPLPFYAYFKTNSASNPTPTGLFTVQTCPKDGLCKGLASASSRLVVPVLLIVLISLFALLH